MPSGLLNQVALPAKLKRAAGKHTYLSSMSMQQLSFINLQILASLNITAGKQSMAKLRSHELSNIVKKIRLIFTVLTHIWERWGCEIVSEYFKYLFPANRGNPHLLTGHTWWLGDNIFYKSSPQMSALHVVTTSRMFSGGFNSQPFILEEYERWIEC